MRTEEATLCFSFARTGANEKPSDLIQDRYTAAGSDRARRTDAAAAAEAEYVVKKSY